MASEGVKVDKVINILLCGVGGQGILLASRLVSEVALASGLDVKSADVHGMAQRGGSVTSQLRMAPEVHSPIIPEGEADFLVALEKLEALRYAPMVKPGGRVFVNSQVITPVSVTMGMGDYPEDAEPRLKKQFDNLVLIDAIGIAKRVGNPRSGNVVLLGALSPHLPFKPEAWEEGIRKLVKPRFVDVNLTAFHQGRVEGEKS